jgi:hypothetical protein
MPADAPITNFTQLSVVAADDWIAVVDKSDLTDDPAGTTKKVSVFDFLGAITLTGAVLLDALTSASFPVLKVSHRTTGVPVAGFGSLLTVCGDSTTTHDQPMAGLYADWADPAHATMIGRGFLTAYNAASSVAGTPCVSWRLSLASGATPEVGFLGAGTSPRLASPDVGTALVTFGLASGTPTFAAANLTGANFFRGSIDGLVTSRASTTTVTVAAGACRDSTDDKTLALTASTKTLQSSGAWATGTGANGLDAGARANNTWYHVWVIANAAGATVDWLFSSSATAPTMPTGYTLKRRIGAVKTDGSGNILDYRQTGDEFWWYNPIRDVNVTNPGLTAVLRTLSVPTGVKCRAVIGVFTYDGGTSGGGPNAGLISDPDVSDSGAVNCGTYSSAANTLSVCQVSCWTNTSSQVRTKWSTSAASTNVLLDTLGWQDQRGKNG